VEASSGNTGNAMSMVAAVKGYKMLVVMPVGMSPERAAISTAFGAQLMTVGDFHVNEALELAGLLGDRSATSRRISSNPNGTWRRTGHGWVLRLSASSRLVAHRTPS